MLVLNNMEIERNKESINILLITSFLMITVVIHAIIKHQYLYGLAWFGLMITSLEYHTNGNYATLDKIMIFSVVIIGLTLFIQITGEITSKLLPIITFISVIIIYFMNLADHFFVHIFGLIGHHSILFLL